MRLAYNKVSLVGLLGTHERRALDSTELGAFCCLCLIYPAFNFNGCYELFGKRSGKEGKQAEHKLLRDGVPMFMAGSVVTLLLVLIVLVALSVYAGR